MHSLLLDESWISWDVTAEHLDEAESLLDTREAWLDAPHHDLAMLEGGPEQRLLAHLDALALGGPLVAERVLLATLEDPEQDMMKIAAATLALLESAPMDVCVRALAQLDAESATQRAGLLLGLQRARRGGLDLWLALPEPRPGLDEAEIMQFVDALIRALHDSGTRLRYEVAGRGHAGVAAALARAAQVIAHHDDRLSLVLGVDSYLDPRTFLWLEHNRCFGPTARSGFPPGEAAGCLVVASARQRKQLGLPCLARIGGLGLAHEARPLDGETGSLGEGMTAALRAATSQLHLPSEAVDAVYCDINGERHRSEEWGFVALRVPELFRTLDYEAPADAWGDLGAASGALLGVLAIQSWARRYARGPRALVLTGSTSGQRGVILLEQPPLA